MSFNAIVLERDSDKIFSANIKSITQEQLLQQEGDTLVKIAYSSLNYKDALALTNKGPVVRLWPMVAGIDGVGTVVKTTSDQYQVGDNVILNGWGCGETHWGCYGEYAYLKSDWLIPLPKNMTQWQAMALGTAGYTAALCVQRIVQHGVKPEHGSILVTGATGGVSSVAIALLNKLGYQVIGSTGKIDNVDYLKQLGVTDVINKNELSEASKPLQKEKWAAVVDVVGSHTLANACAQTQYGGIVACCGLAQGMDLPTSVAPFILRGVTLAGIDSVMASYQKRVDAWHFLAEHLSEQQLNQLATTIKLKDCVQTATQMMKGNIKGRFVVDVSI